MFERRIGTISFAATLILMLAALTAGAGPQDAQSDKVANAARVNAEFAPSMADPTKRSAWFDLGEGVEARLVPVKGAGASQYAVDVLLKRAEGNGEAVAVELNLKCSAETMNPMGRIPMPVQVDLGAESLKVSMEAGQRRRHRVTFKTDLKGNPMLMGRAPEVASVTIEHGKVVHKDAIYVALEGMPKAVPAKLQGGIGSLVLE